MSAKEAVWALLEKGYTISTAESLTAGMVSAAVCDVPGASGCFLGGVCAYQDEVKERMLDVPETVIQKHSAVSALCAKHMALAMGNRKIPGRIHKVGFSPGRYRNLRHRRAHILLIHLLQQRSSFGVAAAGGDGFSLQIHSATPSVFI